MNRIVLLILMAIATACLFVTGCAFNASGYGVSASWAIGDGSIGCAYTDEGHLQGGSDCVAGGTLSEVAAEVLAGAIDEKGDSDSE